MYLIIDASLCLTRGLVTAVGGIKAIHVFR